MTKKLYIQPEAKVVDINNEQILAGSPEAQWEDGDGRFGGNNEEEELI